MVWYLLGYKGEQMASVAYTNYYSINGFSYDFRYYWDSDDDTATSFDASVSLDVTAAPGAGFTYTIDEVDLADGTIRVDIDPTADTYGLSLEGIDAYSADIDANIIGVNWTQGGATFSTTMLELELVKGENATRGYEYGTRYYFVLDGDAVPEFSSLSEFSSFDDHNITSVYKVSGDFGPGTLIEWGDVASATVVGADEEITGTAGRDVLDGGYGDDYFFSSKGKDTYKGGTGSDQVTFQDDPSGVVANLAKGKAIDGWGDTDKLISIEMLRGSLFDDKLIGDGGNNIIRGLGGDDILNGGKGKHDEVRYDRDARNGGTDGVKVNLKKGTATDGFGDTDTLKKFEDVRGSDSRDKIIGNGRKNELEGENGNDVLKGLGGKDTLDGGDGKDKLLGNGGADTLDGGKGNDKLIGGGGNDSLYGGDGADRFIFKGKFGDDVIYDFETAGTKEKIDLRKIGAIDSFDDLTDNHLSKVGGHAVIDDGSGNTITLDGIALSDLANNDFLF